MFMSVIYFAFRGLPFCLLHQFIFTSAQWNNFKCQSDFSHGADSGGRRWDAGATRMICTCFLFLIFDWFLMCAGVFFVLFVCMCWCCFVCAVGAVILSLVILNFVECVFCSLLLFCFGGSVANINVCCNFSRCRRFWCSVLAVGCCHCCCRCTTWSQILMNTVMLRLVVFRITANKWVRWSDVTWTAGALQAERCRCNM